MDDDDKIIDFDGYRNRIKEEKELELIKQFLSNYIKITLVDQKPSTDLKRVILASIEMNLLEVKDLSIDQIQDIINHLTNIDFWDNFTPNELL